MVALLMRSIANRQSLRYNKISQLKGSPAAMVKYRVSFWTTEGKSISFLLSQSWQEVHMRTYQKRNRAAFLGALVCILCSNTFAVVLQFFKGDVLDYSRMARSQRHQHHRKYLYTLGLFLEDWFRKRHHGLLSGGKTTGKGQRGAKCPPNALLKSVR